ncbi:MAG: hypothetical protein ACHQM6_02425 [Candidatus Kapaibacterium sp.]
MKYILFFSLFFACGLAYSQDQHPLMTPGRTIDSEPPKKYADSAEFAKLFKEFYPVIKPEKSLKEQSDQYFQGIARAFKMQGIDSAEAAKIAFTNLDQKAFEKIYFDTYRRNLSAKELKKYMEFVKTPEGKHIAEVFPNLQRVSGDANMYIARTMNINLGPLRQAAHEKWEKEHPGQKMGTPMAPAMHGGELIDKKKAALRDSLIKSQQMLNKTPNTMDSLATPQPKQ